MESAVHAHPHPHVHPEEETKRVMDRLARAVGHLESVRTMVRDGRDCSEVLIQLAAVKAAISSTGKLVLKTHIEHCIVEAVQVGNMQKISDLNKAIDQFL